MNSTDSPERLMLARVLVVLEKLTSEGFSRGGDKRLREEIERVLGATGGQRAIDEAKRAALASTFTCDNCGAYPYNENRATHGALDLCGTCKGEAVKMDEEHAKRAEREA